MTFMSSSLNRWRTMCSADDVHGIHNFHWIMGGWDNRICGFEIMNGRRADNNPEAVKSDAVFQTGRQVDVVGYVRKGSVSVSMDGKLIAEHKSDYADLTALNDTYIGDGALGGTWALPIFGENANSDAQRR